MFANNLKSRFCSFACLHYHGTYEGHLTLCREARGMSRKINKVRGEVHESDQSPEALVVMRRGSATPWIRRERGGMTMVLALPGRCIDRTLCPIVTRADRVASGQDS